MGVKYSDYCRRCDGSGRPTWRNLKLDRWSLSRRFNNLSQVLQSGGTLAAMESSFEDAIVDIYRQERDVESTILFECVKRLRDDVHDFLSSEGTMASRIRYIQEVLRIGELRDKVRYRELHGAEARDISCLKRVERRTLIFWIKSLLEEGYIELHEIDPPPILDLYDYGFHGDCKSHVKRVSRGEKFNWRKVVK